MSSMSASTSNQSNKIALQRISASSSYCPGQRIDSFVGWITYYIATFTFLLLVGASTFVVESSQSSNTAALFTSSTRHPMNSRALFISSPSILTRTRFVNHRGFNNLHHVTTSNNRPSFKAAISNCKLDHSKLRGYYTCSSTTTRLFHSNNNNIISSSDSNNTKRSMSTNSYNENQQFSLTEQLATRLVQSSIPDTTTTTLNNSKPIKACIAVAGVDQTLHHL